jgi:uncharacterized protein YraI
MNFKVRRLYASGLQTLLTTIYAVITFALFASALAFGTIPAIAIVTLAVRAGTISLFILSFFC